MAISVLAFLDALRWIDGQPLVVEPYRRDIFRRALDERNPDGTPRYNLILAGRGKKNWKSADLVLAGLFVLLCRDSPQGSDVLIVANDADQAGQDLTLAKKLVAANPDIAADLIVLANEIRRADHCGLMRIVPAGHAIGEHGKTYAAVLYDEIHGYRDWDILEALAPDPTRTDAIQWITSYDTIMDVEGVPLHDLKQIGLAGSDPKMLFSWYSADFCTDENFASLPPDERANPSMSSWPEGRAYIEQQRRRLPSARFRRLHHNLPGAPQGAFFDQALVDAAIVTGRQLIEPLEGVDYLAAVDMSGGSSDDAVLSIAHWDGSKSIVDYVIQQAGNPPFNPRDAVARFAAVCHRYHCREVHGDAYAGETFRRDFSVHNVDYVVEKQTRTDWYENLEVALNSGQVELPDVPKLRRQLLTIVRRGAVLDHPPGQHDDYANAVAIAAVLVNPDLGSAEPPILTFYKRQSEAITAAASTVPTLLQENAGQPIMQNWMRRPSDGFVRVNVPTPTSHLHVGGVSYLVSVEDGAAVCWMTPTDALDLLGGSNVPFIEANRPLLEKLKERAAAEGYVPRNQQQGISVQAMLQAAQDAQPKSLQQMAIDAINRRVLQ